MNILIGLITILFLDIILSVDNAILIASTTRNLDEKEGRKARIIGSSLAVLLRLIFVALIMFVLQAATNIPSLYIIGGIMLMAIGLLITNKSKEGEESKVANSAFKAIVLILAGDVMLSFDNAFIIADVATGMNIGLVWTVLVIVMALLLSLFILLFFAKQLTKLMDENPWIIYVACWLLISVGIEMMFKDKLLSGVTLDHIYLFIISYGLGGIIATLKWQLDIKLNR